MERRPLDGVRVIDLTNVLAGPYCSYQLALFGAEVIKVERPGSGDLARHLGPDPALNDAGVGASFLAQNAGKKSVELDLKNTRDRQRLESLVAGADVLVENFRAGVMDRLGFGWDMVHRLNPRLIYCAITGFGQTGPMSRAPAYDQIVQGLSGMMSITGTEQTAPLRVGFPVCDTVGGLMAALAITAALTSREDAGGRFLDVSMLEASISAMGWAVSNYQISGVETRAMGDQNATAAPSGTFRAADGPLNIAANQQQQYESLCRVVGRLDLIEDDRFRTREHRKQHRDALNNEINRALARRGAQEWSDELTAVGVPAAPILSIAQAVEAPQLAHRDFFYDVPFPGNPARTVRTSSNGVQIDGEALHPIGGPPLLGQHNGELHDALPRPRDGKAVPTRTLEG